MIEHYSYRIQNIIQKELFGAKESIRIAVAWFTNDLLFQPLLLKLETGVDVEIILNKDEINVSENNEIDFDLFVQKGGKLHWNDTSQLMHEKFCIIDNSIVIFGTYNWTNKAEFNEESITLAKGEDSTTSFYSNKFTTLANKYPVQKVELTGKDGNENDKEDEDAEFGSNNPDHTPKKKYRIDSYPLLTFYDGYPEGFCELDYLSPYHNRRFGSFDNSRILERVEDCEGYCIFYKEGKFGIIDSLTRNIIITPLFDDILWYESSHKNRNNVVLFKLRNYKAVFEVSKLMQLYVNYRYLKQLESTKYVLDTDQIKKNSIIDSNYLETEFRKLQKEHNDLFARKIEDEEVCLLERPYKDWESKPMLYDGNRIVWGIKESSIRKGEESVKLEYYGTGMAFNPNVDRDKQEDIFVFKFKTLDNKDRVFLTLDDLMHVEHVYHCRMLRISDIYYNEYWNGDVCKFESFIIDLLSGQADKDTLQHINEYNKTIKRTEFDRVIYINYKNVLRKADSKSKIKINYRNLTKKRVEPTEALSYDYHSKGSLNIWIRTNINIEGPKVIEELTKFFQTKKYIELRWTPLFEMFKQEVSYVSKSSQGYNSLFFIQSEHYKCYTIDFSQTEMYYNFELNFVE